MDETHIKIMKAAMDLVTEKGYDAMTTKEIASRAGVNESTLFRKFQGKLDIVLTAMDYTPWYPHINPGMFSSYTGELKTDLLHFARIYLENVTPYFVDLSIGLRSPQLYEHTASKIMKVPKTYRDGVKAYFDEMIKQQKIKVTNTESASIMFLSVCFGFVFFKASFKDSLTKLQMDEYISNSIEIFMNGII